MNNFRTKDSRVLIVSFRYFGDALLCSSLAERIKQMSSSTEVTFLCYSRIAPILKNIKSIDSIITVDENASLLCQLSSIIKYVGKFDLALVTQLSTRAVVFGRILARHTVGFEPGMSKRNWWKRYLFSHVATENTDVQPQILKFNELLDVVGYPKPDFLKVGLPSEDLPDFAKIRDPYFVIHPTPQKMDRRMPIEKWRNLIKHFLDKGYAIAITGSGISSEIAYVNDIISPFKGKIYNLAGRLSWGQTANVIKGAEFYIGIDTGTTHLAAATGVLTYAIFGPTPISGWGPWGLGQVKPYESFAGVSVQKRGNVTVLGYRPFDFCSSGCDSCRRSHSSALCFSKVDVDSLIDLIEKDLDKQNNNVDKTRIFQHVKDL